MKDYCNKLLPSPASTSLIPNLVLCCPSFILVPATQSELCMVATLKYMDSV